jgi:hypothetical protein
MPNKDPGNTDKALAVAEEVFQILYLSHEPFAKMMACILFLQAAPDEFYADQPRVCEAIVAGALEYGANWEEVADAARINVTEARRKWERVACATWGAERGGSRPPWLRGRIGRMMRALKR